MSRTRATTRELALREALVEIEERFHCSASMLAQRASFIAMEALDQWIADLRGPDGDDG